MRKSTQNIFSILAILFSVNLYGASESAETFRYGPAYLTDYIPASGLIYDFSFPEWIEGVWWAAYYSDTETQEVTAIPLKPEQKMGRPFEFYGWLVRVPDGTENHKDFKAIRFTEMLEGKAWALNMVSLEDPSKGAILVINKIKQEGSNNESLVFRWMIGSAIQQRAIYAISIGAGSIMQFDNYRKSYLEDKYITSPTIEEFDYKAWYNRAISRNGAK